MYNLDNNLLLQISKYCNVNTLNNLSKINKQFRDLRLYRLFFGEIFNKRFGLVLIKEVNDYKTNYSYNMSDYIKDIIFSLNHPLNLNYRHHRKNKYFIGKSSNWYNIINYDLENTKNIGKIKKI